MSDNESDGHLLNASRRRLLLQGAGAACLAGVGLLVAEHAARAQAKLPRTAVSYRPKPNGDKKCSTCALFEAPRSCKNVAGDISPDGWCLLWRAK
jgi:hypothetical protein